MSQLIRAVDEALKDCKKKWNQVLSLRVFYRNEMNITNEVLSRVLETEILKRSNIVPAITSIPASALNFSGDSLVACALHVV